MRPRSVSKSVYMSTARISKVEHINKYSQKNCNVKILDYNYNFLKSVWKLSNFSRKSSLRIIHIDVFKKKSPKKFNMIKKIQKIKTFKTFQKFQKLQNFNN